VHQKNVVMYFTFLACQFCYDGSIMTVMVGRLHSACCGLQRWKCSCV